MSYNYFEEMKKDILEYLEENGAEYKGLDREEIEERLNNDLWENDSITGNGRGRYWDDTMDAKRAVFDNMDLCTESLKEFYVPMETITENFLEENWHYFDATIRCYLLGQAIEEALNDYEER